MKILIITLAYPPKKDVGGKRFFFLKKELEHLGHEVIVLCPAEQKGTPKEESVIRVKRVWFRTEDHKDFISQLFLVAWKGFSRLLFVDTSMDWILLSIPVMLRLLVKKKPKVVILTAPPFSLFCLSPFVKLLRRKVILDYRDPWFPYIENRRDMRPIYSLRCKIIESFHLRIADRVVFNTAEAMDKYIIKFPWLKGKSFCITNGLQSMQYQDNIKDNIKDLPYATFAYAGNFYGKRKLSYLLDAISKAFEDKILDPGSFHFVVYGVIPKSDRRYLDRFPWGKLFIEHDYIAPDVLFSKLRKTRVLYLVQGDDHYLSVPYKAFTYLETNRPILAVLSRGSATDNFLSKFSRVYIGYIGDFKSIYEALNMALNHKQYDSDISEREYNWEVIAKKYSDLLLNLNILRDKKGKDKKIRYDRI